MRYKLIPGVVTTGQQGKSGSCDWRPSGVWDVRDVERAGEKRTAPQSLRLFGPLQTSTFRMSYYTADDTRLYYAERGRGAPLLFVHGLGSSSRDWAAQVDDFADRHRVLRVDLRGHGRSERGTGPYSIAQFAREVAVLLRKHAEEPAHVVGLSMGGMVALELAASAPRLLRGLVVVNSAADMRLHSWRDVWFYVSRRLAVQALGMRRVGRLLARQLFVKPNQGGLRRTLVERWAGNDKQAYSIG